ASSHLVGAAAAGGDWTLDVHVGTPEVGNPFTATTLTQYDGVLTNQIWFSVNYGTYGVATANVSGATATSPNGTPPGFTTPPNPPFTPTNPFINASIAVDAADGLYFIANNPTGYTTQAIYEGHINGSTFGPGGPLLQQIYATPNTNGVD